MQFLVPFNFLHASFYITKSLSLRDIGGLRSSHFWDAILRRLVGSNNISEESAVMTEYSGGTQDFQKSKRGTQHFQKSKSHLKVAI